MLSRMAWFLVNRTKLFDEYTPLLLLQLKRYATKLL